MQQNVPTALSSFAAYHSALLGLIDDIKSGAAQTESPIWQEEVDVVVREMIDPVRLGKPVRNRSRAWILTEFELLVTVSDREWSETDPVHLWQEHEGV